MPKIYNKGNYTIVENPDYQTYTRSEIKYEENDLYFILKNYDSDVENFLVSIKRTEVGDWTNESGLAYTEASMRNFLVDGTSVPSLFMLDFNKASALGRASIGRTWNKFGYNNDVDTGTEVIAQFGGTFTPPTTAYTLDIVSASANDTDGGTGMNSIVILGIDENRLEQTETITLNGTTTVTTTNTWLGVNRISANLCGSLQTNAGLITATHTTGGQTLATVAAGESVTQQCIFYVQSEHTFLLNYIYGNILKTANGQKPTVTIKGWEYNPTTNTKKLIYEDKEDTALENHIVYDPPVSLPVPEKSVLWFEITTNEDNTQIDWRFGGEEVRNN